MSRLKNGTITIQEFYGGTKLLSTPRLGQGLGSETSLTLNQGPSHYTNLLTQTNITQ